jgi:iron complex transport system substrate-binding protein
MAAMKLPEANFHSQNFIYPMGSISLRWLIVICVVILVTACTDQKSTPPPPSSEAITYATGFTIQPVGDATLVTVSYPFQGAMNGYQYLLVKKGSSVPFHDDQTTVIEVPIQTIVCTSTTHIPLLDYLGETDALVGFPTTDYISSEKMRKRIDDGWVTELGIDKGMNLEKLFSLTPSVVMGYTMSSDLGQLKKIQELGIPVVINAEYLETHPLGRAEWIKLMGLLFDKWPTADSVFRQIEKEYLDTQALVNQSEKPTVLSGIVYGDGWFLPGGQNYAARLLKDAGYRYLWESDSTQGFQELSFESVYTKAAMADYWIGVASYSTLAGMETAEKRYALFQAFQQKHVYSYDARKGAKGGSEFLELGYLRPDLILKDLVKIGHPDLLPDYKLFFHRQLE